MNLPEASSPRPSPPQVCGGEGEEGAGGSWAQGAISVRGVLCPPRRARSARPATAPYTHLEPRIYKMGVGERRRRDIYVELPSNKIPSPIGAAYSIGVNLPVCKAGKMPLLDGA